MFSKIEGGLFLRFVEKYKKELNFLFEERLLGLGPDMLANFFEFFRNFPLATLIFHQKAGDGPGLYLNMHDLFPTSILS